MVEPRALTREECREQFLENVRTYARYWQQKAKEGHDDAFNGLAFSLLVLIDGGNAATPAFKLLTDPHPEDEAFLREQGENWWPAGVDITDVQLHERYYDQGTK